MIRRVITTAALLAAAPSAVFAMDMGKTMDDPLLFSVFAEQLEWRSGDGEGGFAWDADAWLGRDLNKAWFKTEGETEGGDIEHAEVQLLYSRAIAPFWDLQAGWRRDLEPGPDRDWLAVGVQGLAPWHFHVDAAVFLGPSGRTAARVEGEYELRLTQRWILAPSAEINAYGEGDPARGIGSGLSTAEAGLRLRYEIRRRLAPYAGVHWEQRFGDTADLAEAEGHDASGWRWTLGLRGWF